MSEVNEYKKYPTISGLTIEEREEYYFGNISKVELLNRVNSLENSLKDMYAEHSKILGILRQYSDNILSINEEWKKLKTMQLELVKEQKKLELGQKLITDKMNVLEAFTKQNADETGSSEISGTNVLNIGDTITFGNYNGSDIEWIILDKKEDSVLIVTKDLLRDGRYNKRLTNITWENCDLRIWLNNKFINEAFNINEKNRIKTTLIENHINLEFKTPGGNATEDQLFLLSIDEANRYFTLDDQRKARHEYWLRSPGEEVNEAACVFGNGIVSAYGYYVDFSIGVRPACWIQI